MIREQSAALRAAQLFADLVQNIDASALAMTMPDDFATLSEDPWTLKDILNYHAYDDAWIPDMLAGRSMSEVGQDKWKGDLLEDDFKANFASINHSACIAIEKLDDPSRTVHCSFGDYSTQDYLLQVLSFRGVRLHDISRVLGMDTKLPEDLVQDMWDLLTPHADEWRQFGVYGPELPVSNDATLQQRLFAKLGFVTD